MTLTEMIIKFDAVPNKFEFPGGDKYELFTRRKTNNKGFIVAVWRMIGEVQEQMIWSAEAETIEGAKHKLKIKILKSFS